MDITPCYVRFEVASEEALERLMRVVHAIRSDKNEGVFREDDAWLEFFNEQELGKFWWPTDGEREDWAARWQATPAAQRSTDPSLKTAWCFLSMLEAIAGGEYVVLGIRRENETTALLEFEPQAYPYGGVTALGALVLAYGHALIGYDDGTGFFASTEA